MFLIVMKLALDDDAELTLPPSMEIVLLHTKLEEAELKVVEKYLHTEMSIHHFLKTPLRFPRICTLS